MPSPYKLSTVNAVAATYTLSCPGLTPGGEHKLYAYIESSAENSDGHLFGPITFTVPKSNGFDTVPYLGSTPTQDGLVLKYKPSATTGK